MTLYTIDYESGVAGQPLALNQVTKPGPNSIQDAGTVTYDATHVMHGSMATKHAPVGTGVSWAAYGNNANLSFDSTGFTVRGYFYFTTTPGFGFITFYDTDMEPAAWLGINATGHLYIRDSVTPGATPLAEGTVPITVNRWLRAELYATVGTSGATVTGALYDGDAIEPIDMVTSAIGNTTAATIDAVWIGKNNYNSNPAEHWVDSVAIETDAVGLLTDMEQMPKTPFRVWDGTTYQLVNGQVWDGTGYVSVSQGTTSG